jgi:hypothetical protein
MLQTLFDNFSHNLFKPMLLFFYAGFSIPLLGIAFEFPKVLYQGLTIYLLLAIGWHGGEELAGISPGMIGQASGFMVLGFLTNMLIGFTAYYVLRKTTRLRKVDAATVAGYYGSDSAGTFVTCLGVLAATQIAFAAYMPVMLAVMEIPGCLVALLLVARLRRNGMDTAGNMPGERGYAGTLKTVVTEMRDTAKRVARPLHRSVRLEAPAEMAEELVAVGADADAAVRRNGFGGRGRSNGDGARFNKFTPTRSLPDYDDYPLPEDHEDAVSVELADSGYKSPANVTLLEPGDGLGETEPPKQGASVGKILHEVFLNPGIFLLFAGLAIGFISRLQGEQVVAKNDSLFVSLFQGMLCLFLLEMGMTAAKRLKDVREAGWQFVAFAIIAPNLFASFGIGIAHLYSMWLGQPFDLGTYALFAVLCGAASYIAVPAVQQIAIPEASPTLPLAAALGLTFSYNVTIGIPVYLMAATALTTYFPVTLAN